MRIFTYLRALAVLFFLGGCNSSEIIPAIDEEISAYREALNQAYGTDGLQRYDIYYPVNANKRPSEVLILLHGGAWVGGDKSYLKPAVGALMAKRKNLTVVNINYRVANGKTVRIEQQLDDVRLLIDHLRSNAARYNLTEQAVVIGGVSAGGHLALNYAYLKNSARSVKAVVGIVAPTDLTSEPLRKAGLERSIQQLLGKTYAEAPDLYEGASPFYIADSRVPSTLLFYGGKDRVVPIEQGEQLKFKLTLLGAKYNYYFYPEETHDFSPALLVDHIIELF